LASTGQSSQLTGAHQCLLRGQDPSQIGFNKGQTALCRESSFSRHSYRPRPIFEQTMNIKGFLDHLRTRGYSPGTVSSYGGELRKFQLFIRERKLRINQVKPIHLEHYLRWRDPRNERNPSTTRRTLACLSSFFDFAAVMSNGHIRNPVRPLRRPRKQPPRPKPLSEPEIATLTDGVANPRDTAIVAILLHSGLRVSELCSLNKDSISVHKLSSGPTERIVGVGRIVGKGRKEREFLVDAHALRLIHRYLKGRKVDDNSALFLSNRGRRIDKRTVQHMLRALSKRLDLPPIHPHQLRSTFATRLNRTGVPTLEISRLLGHASLETTMQYVRPDERRIRTEYFAAFEKLTGPLDD
jgi:site-specific recombinase XerD